jgi:hypothetical protein
MVRVFRVDFDFVAAIGLVTGDVGALGGAFGDEMVGMLGEVDIGALRGAFGDEMAGVLGDRLVDSLVSVLRVLFLRVDLDLESVRESVIGGVLGSPSNVDAVCALAVGDMK